VTAVMTVRRLLVRTGSLVMLRVPGVPVTEKWGAASAAS